MNKIFKARKKQVYAKAKILLGVVGNWATMVSDGTNWIIMQAASNNNLLLE